jgi:polyhydroxybutyrate depolymerase
MKLRPLGLSLAMLLLPACPSLPGLHHRTLPHDGRTRSYELFVPDSAKAQALPLVVALHGLASTGTTMAEVTGFHKVGAREGFIVAYPNGLHRSFNFGVLDSPDDAGFILAVIDDIADEFPVDRTRVYLTGLSNGGFMTHYMACDAASVFAAAAPVMSSLTPGMAESCEPSERIPILMIHGTEDGVVPFEGSPIDAADGHVFATLPVPDAVQFWVAANGIEGPPTVETLPDVDPADGTTTTLERYEGVDGIEVLFYIVDGGGHTWPGAPPSRVDTTSQDFDATEVIWDFFSRHARPAEQRGLRLP